MDFFKLQDERKMQSGVLLLLFVTVLLVMAVVFHVISVAINFPVSGEMDFSNPHVTAVGFVILLWVISLIGCYFRTIDVREGGAAVAKGLGAVEANPASRDGDERLLIDVVSEIAVASACEVPRVFIMHREYAINAFVVGGFSGKEALVVSRGALYGLDRDQLAAVVAHEFGHISQGDIPLNMYLMVALSGLNAIDEVGKILMVKSHSGHFLQPGLFVGFIIRVIGSIGVFLGRVVRSAFTRQREYLADACAVQFTRSPFHLAAALRAVHDANEDQSIHNVRAEEIAHLCFQGGSVTKWYDRIFSSHPPLQKRIDEICPHFDIKVRQRQRAEKIVQG